MATTVDQLKLDGAVADAAYKSLEAGLTNPVTGEVKPHPLGPDFKHLSTKDRITRFVGYHKALTLQQTLEQGQALEEERQAAAGERKTRADAILQAIAKQDAFTKDYRDFSAPNSAGRAMGAQPMMNALDPGLAATLSGMGQERQPSGDDIMHMMLKAGMPPADIDHLADAVHRMSQTQPDKDLPIQFQDVPGIPGAQGWRHRNSAGIVQNPEVRATAQADAQERLIQARAGQLTAKDLLASYQNELKQLDNPANWIGTTAEDRAAHRAEITGKINALRQGESSTSSPAPNAATPLPKTQKELKQGVQYKTSQGAATWDGEKFVIEP